MSYQELIQTPGKSILKKVKYYNESNTLINVNADNIEEVKIKFNTGLTGTLMKGIELILKEKIDTTKGIYVEIVASYGSNSATESYGPYYLKDVTYNADDKTYTHQCYDTILKTMVDYEEIDIEYPTTIQDFYDTLIETLGYTSSVSLVNGTIPMTKDIYTGIGYTYRSVIQDIAEANGILLYADGNEIKEATLGDDTSKATIDDDILKNSNIDFGEHFGAINTIVLARSADSDRIYYPTTLPDDPKEYMISDNQLMNNDDRNIYLPGIYSKLNGIEYDIFDTELVGYGGFTPLQKVEFETGDNTYTSYVFNNEIDITAGYNEVIYTDMPNESVTDYSAASSEDSKINAISLIVNKQEQTITGVVTRVETYDERIDNATTTSQNASTKADSATAQVDSLRDSTVTKDEFNTYQSSVSTQFQQTAESFEFDFNTLTTQLNTTNQTIIDNQDNLSKFIRFENGTIILGSKSGEDEEENRVWAVLTNDGLYFVPEGTDRDYKESAVAYFDKETLVITNSINMYSVKIGDYKFQPRLNGSLSFGKENRY